jgi:hypothetical protein
MTPVKTIAVDHGGYAVTLMSPQLVSCARSGKES